MNSDLEKLAVKIKNKFSLKDLDISSFMDISSKDVTCYQHENQHYYVDDEQIVYIEIPIMTGGRLGKSIGIMKNKTIYLDKKLI